VRSDAADAVIVGAGLAGLLAAARLAERGYSVVVLERSAGVGGRLATRRIGAGVADHGAQFLTVRSPAFSEVVDEWRQAGILFLWSRGWSDGSLAVPKGDGHSRYAVRGGMTALAKHLAQRTEVRRDAAVVGARVVDDGWVVDVADGSRTACRALLLTPPVPQSLEILDASSVALARADRRALERVRYAPNLTGLFLVDGEVMLPEPGALQRPGAPIGWMADNRRKGISSEATVVTVQASAAWSAREWGRSDDEALESLRVGLLPFLAPAASVLEAQLKRWRYSLPTVIHRDSVVVARGLPPLAFAGDAFGGPRVEGAVLSGLAAAEALAGRLPPPHLVV
jgi:hypothetical protein